MVLPVLALSPPTVKMLEPPLLSYFASEIDAAQFLSR
jgi:hypothetical protein